MIITPPLPAPTGILDGPIGLLSDGLLYDDTGTLIYDVDIATVPDDGGTLMTGSSDVLAWPIGVAIYAFFIDGDGNEVPCYSGVIGQGYQCFSEDGTSLSWVAPPMPIGTYEMLFTSEGGFTATLTTMVEVVHRAFTTRLYGLRTASALPRAIGPRSIGDEE